MSDVPEEKTGSVMRIFVNAIACITADPAITDSIIGESPGESSRARERKTERNRERERRQFRSDRLCARSVSLIL